PIVASSHNAFSTSDFRNFAKRTRSTKNEAPYCFKASSTTAACSESSFICNEFVREGIQLKSSRRKNVIGAALPGMPLRFDAAVEEKRPHPTRPVQQRRSSISGS